MVQCNSDKDLYLIRPANGGPTKWINRQLLILDPRKDSYPSESLDPLQGLPETTVQPDGSSSSTSVGDSDEDNWVIIYDGTKPTLPSTPPAANVEDLPLSNLDSHEQSHTPLQQPQGATVPEPTPGLRRSKRLTAKRGQYPAAIT